MKILMVVPAIGAVYGGPSKIVMELAEAIGKTGNSVDLVTTNANGNIVLDSPLLTWIEMDNYRVQYFPYWDILDYKYSWALTVWLFKNITSYDIVHTHAIFSYPLLPAYWTCQKNKVPYVATPHGMLEPWALAYKANKKKLYYTLLEKPALQKASAIHMTASTEAEKIKSLNLKPDIELIPNGIHRKNFETLANPELFYQQFPHTRNKKIILFLGRIDPKKGLDLLAKAFAKCHQTFPETHLIIAGQDNIGFLPTVQSYFRETGCYDAVTFTGMLVNATKYAALSAANLYVAPSYSEGFSMSVLEGMASGLPCVITKGCNFPESAEVAKIVNIDSDQVADALISFVRNPIGAKEMGDRARQFILENYTWDKIAQRMILVYKKIIFKAHPTRLRKISTKLPSQ